MTKKKSVDLIETLKDAHAHFFLLAGEKRIRLRLWDILPDSIVIDIPKGAPMRKTIIGLIPTLKGDGTYEIEGKVETEPLEDQMPGTIRIKIDSSDVKLVNRRLYPRYHFTPPVNAKIVEASSGKAIEGKIVNLSAGGLRVETSIELEPRGIYAFRFEVELDDEIHELGLIGKILYDLPAESGHAYGVKFGVNEEAAIKRDREVPVENLDQTVGLMELVNKLLVLEGK